MALSDEQVAKFQALYKSRFGREITKDEAYAKGIKLIRMIELVYKPMTKEEYALLEQRRQQITT